MTAGGLLSGEARDVRSVPSWMAPLSIGVLALLAFARRWDQDDAFISYRYAENWARGLGPVWNDDLAVEGYSNFSWVALLALARVLGAPTVEASLWLGTIAFVLQLWIAHRLARLLLGDTLALVALLLVGTNYTTFCYATGGLETALNAALVNALLYAGVSAWFSANLSRKRLAFASCLFGAAVMTRPDGVIAASCTCAWLLFVRERRRSSSTRPLDLLALFAPVTLLVAAWLAFKLRIYGQVLPNTYWVKLGVHTSATWVRGAVYVATFLASYWFWSGIAVACVAWRAFRGPWLFLATFVGLWLVYAVRSGGDIMEFRQLVPVVTPLVLLVLHGVRSVPWHPAKWFVVALLPIGSAVHAIWFASYVPVVGFGTIPRLESMVRRGASGNWTAIGLRLAELFPGTERPTIAVSPAGAIPYYSGLRAIDVLGLNDPWVARHGILRTKCRACAAHPRVASLSYLKSARVDLVLGHPMVVTGTHGDSSSIVRQMFYEEPTVDYDTLTGDERLLFVPVGGEKWVAALQMRPHPAVDALVDEGRIVLAAR